MPWSSLKVFESLFSEAEAAAFNSGEVSSPRNLSTSIKIMDTIIFKKDFKPYKWIFTDLIGRVQFKDIGSITVSDVIRAFLVNLNENKKNEFSNQDLIEFLSSEVANHKICFALIDGKRHFLKIQNLCDIKNIFPKGIDAL
jgi:hypothetical protein